MHNGITVLDPGHRYELAAIDGAHPQVLQFVKRCDLEQPERFPGNTNAYPGTTLQIVIRALLERMRYLQGQVKCLENTIIIRLLKLVLWLLEFRAARRHRRFYWHGPNYAARSLICTTCGHTVCDHQ